MGDFDCLFIFSVQTYNKILVAGSFWGFKNCVRQFVCNNESSGVIGPVDHKALVKNLSINQYFY